MIRFRGHSDGKVVIPDEPISIPTHRELEVTVREIEAAGRPDCSRDVLLRIAQEAEAVDVDLPTDLAAQHDHYLYGTPKR